jgi:mannose-1-phosphate guanylyltransferase
VTLPAVILVGGQGTRLRPLTETTRKDMLPLVDRPLLAYTFEHLRRHGVRRAVVSCGYMPTQIEEHFGDAYGELALEYRVEEEPLGTGGGIGYAARGLDSTFFALNGDSLREADLGQLVDFHRESGGKATIMLTPVADPSRYGLVRLAPDGRVRQFLEKPRPEEIDTDLINAGLYVLEPEVLDLIPEGRAVSIEREVFPRLCEEGSVFGLAQPGYWLDVGTPESYLQAHRDVLERTLRTELGEALGAGYTLVDPTARVHPEARLVPPVYIGPGAVVEAGVRAGSLAVVGAGARLGAQTIVENAVVAAGAVVGEGSTVIGSIVGADARVGRGCSVNGLAVVGPGADLAPRNALDHGLRVGAGASIPEEALRFS